MNAPKPAPTAVPTVVVRMSRLMEKPEPRRRISEETMYAGGTIIAPIWATLSEACAITWLRAETPAMDGLAEVAMLGSDEWFEAYEPFMPGRLRIYVGVSCLMSAEGCWMASGSRERCKKMRVGWETMIAAVDHFWMKPSQSQRA